MINSQIDNNSDLKQDLIDKVLLVGASTGVGVFFISLFPLNEFYINADFFFDIFALIVLFGTYFLRDKIDVKIKMNTINIMLVLLLVSDLLENGINTPDFILMVLIPFFSILIYNLKITLLFYGFCSALFLCIGHLFHLGIISSPDFNVAEASIFRWYETLLMISVVTFVITLFVNKFNDRVYNLIQNLENQNTQLLTSQSLIEENLNEKNVLLQEIHHRVKNNLAVVSGLLSLQSYHIKNDQLKMVLNKSMNRILSIAKVHEMLYESKKFNNIPFDTYIKELSEIILSSMNEENKSIDFKTDISVEQLSINQGVPLGIIFNELITNSVKYGFEKQDGNEITIIVRPRGKNIEVVYSDNGIGIKDFETSSEKSLGFTLIKSLMQQIEAEYDYETESQFKLTFEFPVEFTKSDFPFSE
ncbi:MAG: sensor histidine kinase [Balneola sp.]|nr:sensor histidine kinase [Balneola sp.]MBO6650547.1 sensor histidine kinase [Balneola sp.]MBO6711544.1 sensor histidine kinase [Balneola sp.]MBO6799740.1 sensor histidine kinase [Balneola sp.]MBO6870819.1 sensor histidine kinase [Balneola sp.]